MLIVTVHNDGQGPDSCASYEVVVRVNDQVIWEGKVGGHDRKDGWAVLLNQVAWVAMEQSWRCDRCKTENVGKEACRECGKRRRGWLAKRDE